MADPSLNVRLDRGLPRQVSVGAGTALFLSGVCFCPEAAIRRLELLVDGVRQPLLAHGMPRLDTFEALHPGADPFALAGAGVDPDSADDPQLRAYAGGFWGFARLRAGAPASIALGLRAELADGRVLTHALDGLEVSELPEPVRVRWPEAEGPRVAICMATFDPPADLLQRQLDSIRGQSHGNWVCVISDDCSGPEAVARLQRAIAEDPRFVLSRSAERLGFYRNFERALALAPSDAEFVAMSDQDDAWHEDKLATLLSEIGEARLIYSDARVVSRTGELISETWWSRRRNNHSDLLSLLVANAITGAASLFPRALLEDALPFPPAQFAHFHDHWVGLAALAGGEVAYVERPLYDYVQHDSASLGHAGANVMPPSLSQRLRGLRPTRERVRLWRLHYFVDACRLMQFAIVLEMRCGERMPAAKRRALRRFLAGEHSSLALGRLAVRGARELVSDVPETLGAEWMLFHAFAWRRLLELSARERPQRRLRLDSLPPPSLALAPGRRAVTPPAQEIAEKISPLRWAVADAAPVRINILIPTVDLKHLFGGYIAKFNLARRLAERGHRVRVITVDPTPPLPADWRRTLESYRGLDGLLDQVELAFGRESDGLELSRQDRFVATTWWTGHIAAEALAHVEAERFLYLIQEYEPFTFPMGSYAALAEGSYRLAHRALFSSELLREYFRRHQIGVFAHGPQAGEADSLAFQNAITPVRAPTADELGQRPSRSLLFYARPEPHAARNMFELGALALAGAVQEGLFQDGWRLHGIGTVARAAELDLGRGISLSLLPRSDQRSYAEVLREHDVGLALMYTPHPSLVPIEMASAGMLTVTNSFENKTAAALGEISSNLITAEPSIAGVVGGLRAASERVNDFEARARGSAVDWSSDWRRSFDDELMARLEAMLG